MSCQTSNQISRTFPLITLPFPPVIKASDIVDSRKPSRFKSKSPNAFLIYRKAFLDQLSLSNQNLKMTDVSKLVSNYWRNESEYVKDEYRKISQEVEIELSEIRKKTTTFRVVWKNSKSSKYTARKRKRNQLKTQECKSEDIQSIPIVKSPVSNENIFYHFVPTEFNSKPSKKRDTKKHITNNTHNTHDTHDKNDKNDTEVTSTSDSKSSCGSCSSPENSQTTTDPEFNEFNEFNEFKEINEINEINKINEVNEVNNFQGSNQHLGFDQTCLENFNDQNFILNEDEYINWYLRNINLLYFNNY